MNAATGFLILSYGLGFVSGVVVCHRISLWWRWGDRGRRL